MIGNYVNGIIGMATGVHDIQKLIERYARTRDLVLVIGETGTGKGKVVEKLHRRSVELQHPGYGKKFVDVDLGTLDENLVQSSLFGHLRGAFTSAIAPREGYLVHAGNGTVYLNEIDSMNLRLQRMLLRALEERRVYPVGSDDPVDINCRFIVSSQRKLEDLARNGEFRRDLYARVDVLRIDLPPLRDRPNDEIILLASTFLKEEGKVRGVEGAKFSDDAIEVLVSYHWPTNVRELQGVVVRALVNSDLSQEIGPEYITFNPVDQPPPTYTMKLAKPDAQASPPKLGDRVRDFERGVIIKTLRKYDGNKAAAARVLGMERSHLHKRMRNLGIIDK